jgi:hypothetical protein
MLQHFTAGLIAIVFTRLLDRTSKRSRRTSSASTALIALSAIVLSSLPLQARAAETFSDGTTVRIRSSSIEAGWHTGRIKRDGRSCWTVQLDSPTGDGYTQLALTIVDALQLGRTGAWTAVNAKNALASAPSYCLAEGSD